VRALSSKTVPSIWYTLNDQFIGKKLTSKRFEILLSVSRGARRKLGAQIEDKMRRGIREGQLVSGTVLPSTRDLSAQLGVSRPVVVDAYAQLAAEGYVILRQGALPRVAASSAPSRARPARQTPPPIRMRFDFRPGIPDLSAFPHSAWLRAARKAMDKMSRADLDYRAPHGCEVLRRTLAEYLGRVRGVVADPDQIVVTSGFAQARSLFCRAVRSRGAKRVALEDPSYTERDAITEAGLSLAPVPIDAEGIRVDILAKSRSDVVIVTPSHQFPTGVVLSAGRRVQLVEDDYDAEYRYDRAPVGALQGLEPNHVAYAGTVSKTLAPALRIGWLVVPWSLLSAMQREQLLADQGCPRIGQHVLAELMTSGEFDRHLRRMRARYRERRDALIEVLADELPDARITGIAAGLHATVELDREDDEAEVLAELRRQGIEVDTLSRHWLGAQSGPPTLLLGYANSSKSAVRRGARELGRAVRRVRAARMK
jgi:GntR family transcriptional regulator / MocR family aminotransferase